MNKVALTALKGSIKKWEGILAGEIEDRGMTNCPLCQKFYSIRNTDKSCEGCPVSQKTKQPYCVSSPYDKWARAKEDGKAYKHGRLGHVVYQDGRAVLSHRGRHWAQKELDFLKSLLPTEEGKSDES